MGIFGALSNPDTQERLRQLSEQLAKVATRKRPPARPRARLRAGAVPAAIMRALADAVEPMRMRDIHAEVERLLGQSVTRSAVKNYLANHCAGSCPCFVRLARGRYRLALDVGETDGPTDR
jgi:hypothetical protein